MDILIGNDPELFVKKDGQLVSAYGLIKGDKHRPQIVRNGMVQVDGMAVEFGIEPAATEEEFVFRIEDVMTQLQALIPEYELVIEPTAEFGEEYINAQPKKARELGCSADFNAWSGGENASPVSSSFRTGSGHIHLGWTKDEDVEDTFHMGASAVKQMDFFLGLPSLIFDTDTKRRELYGKAGAFRPKPYGCEYRTLSNFWLKDKSLMRLMYRNAQEGINRLIRGDDLSERYGNIEDIINNNDVASAIGIMTDAEIDYELVPTS